MKLLVDAREFVAGRFTGIARFLSGLLDALLRFHPDVRVSCAMTKRCALPRALADRVEVLYLPAPFDLALAAASRSFDLLLSPYPKLPPFAFCPMVHTVHDVLYLTHPAYRGRLWRRAGGLLRLKHAASIASLSWFDSRASLEACRALGVRPRNARVRHLAIDARFAPDGEAVPIGRFLFVGNGLPHKNLDVLIEALRLDPRLKLDCVGLLPERRAHHAARAAAFGVADRVAFFAADDDALVSLYRMAQALVLPSTAEGFGLPPLEAMACGTPAIVADLPVLREVCGDAARFVAPNDAEGWAQAMAAMLDAEERRRWQKKGLRHVAAMRAPEGWRKHCEDLLELLG